MQNSQGERGIRAGELKYKKICLTIKWKVLSDNSLFLLCMADGYYKNNDARSGDVCRKKVNTSTEN